MESSSQNINTKVHIAFSVHDLSDEYNYINSTAVASAIMHCSCTVVVHILCDLSLNKDKMEYDINKLRYIDLCDNFGSEIQFHDVQVPNVYQTYATTDYLTVGTYFRLFSADILSDIDRVIYFDGDIIVNLDLMELWTLDISPYLIAARPDPLFQDLASKHPYEIKYEYHKLGFTNKMIKNYFNSGVIIFDLKKIRSEFNLSKSNDKFIQSNPSALRADQDALNYVFKGDYYKLDKKYNLFSQEEIDSNEFIVHYCNYKPWYIVRTEIDYLYWRYASQTRWATDNPEIFMKKMLSVVNFTESGLKNYRKYRFYEKLKIILIVVHDLFNHLFSQFRK